MSGNLSGAGSVGRRRDKTRDKVERMSIVTAGGGDKDSMVPGSQVSAVVEYMHELGLTCSLPRSTRTYRLNSSLSAVNSPPDHKHRYLPVRPLDTILTG